MVTKAVARRLTGRVAIMVRSTSRSELYMLSLNHIDAMIMEICLFFITAKLPIAFAEHSS